MLITQHCKPKFLSQVTECQLYLALIDDRRKRSGMKVNTVKTKTLVILRSRTFASIFPNLLLDIIVLDGVTDLKVV